MLAGLACVYSGIPWLFALLGAISSGWLPGAAAEAVCLAGSLAVGVGLCAGERWAWASATCLAAIYAVGAAGIATALGSGIAGSGSALSWQPVAAGLTSGVAIRTVVLSVCALPVALGLLTLLWKAQPDFDVPYRRAFTTLLHDGAVPAAAIVAADLFLLYHAWKALIVRP